MPVRNDDHPVAGVGAGTPQKGTGRDEDSCADTASASENPVGDELSSSASQGNAEAAATGGGAELEDQGELDPEDYDYMKEMMAAMEDGIGDNDNEGDGSEVPEEDKDDVEDEEEYTMAFMQAMDDGIVDSESAAPDPAHMNEFPHDFHDHQDNEEEYAMAMMAAMEDGIKDEEGEGNEPPEEDKNDGEDEEEYTMAFMQAMDDGIVASESLPSEENLNAAPDPAHMNEFPPNPYEFNEDEDDEEEYAMAMMNAMDDGLEEEEEDDGDEVFPVAAAAQQQSSTFANVGQNILQTCSSLTTAVREYYRMSQSDQLQVWDDLTGLQGQKRVFVEGKELPNYSEQFEPRQMVEAALKQLPQELQRMPSSEPHAALDLALEKHPRYVLARGTLLKFLRTEKFDVFATAVRMCRHFEIKLELFGEAALGREITLDDLDEDDMDAFKSGYLQILQQRDQGQRPVLFYYKAVSSECYKDRTNILRSFWYMMNKIGQSEDIQKLGISNLVYNVGGFPRQGMDYEKSRRMAYAFRAIPVRYNNFYVCLDDKPWLTVVETFAVMITRFLRVRLRMIRGTHDEVFEKLKAVGIPVQALPVTQDNELLREAHLEWIERLRESEKIGIRVDQARSNVPDVVEDSLEDYMAQEVSDSTDSAYGRGRRRRLDVPVVPAEQD